LAKAAADLTIDRRPIAFVNLETFKGHSYPDVLLSVFLESFNKLKEWFETAGRYPASRKSFWLDFFGKAPERPPINKAEVGRLVNEIDNLALEIHQQLHAEETVLVKETTESEQEVGTALRLGARAGVGSASIDAGASTEERVTQRSQTVEETSRSKIDFLHRNIISYQALFRQIAQASGGDIFLFLDDLYHIKKADQPKVIDFFHRIAQGSQLWFKVGTIRHRTEWYRHGDPSVGVKLGDDADEIDLDLTLDRYQATREFLISVLQGIAAESGFDNLGAIISTGAADRLVLASGGVARDFLGIFRRSIIVARERGERRGPRIGAEDVNQAAGEYNELKRDELNRDTLEERDIVEGAFEAVKQFCIDENNANCFLIEKDRVDIGAKLIEELVDLRLLHLVQSRVTISGRTGRLYVAYMLDLGEYAGERTRRGLEKIQFWTQKGKGRLRRARLVYEPWAPPNNINRG
jgi:hypothetical protein